MAGDYLRDIHSGRRIFVLVTRGGKNSWEHPQTEKVISFDELVVALKDHWSKISSQFPDVTDIAVVGIDLGERFETPKKRTGQLIQDSAPCRENPNVGAPVARR